MRRAEWIQGEPSGGMAGSNNSRHGVPTGERTGTALGTASAGAGSGRLLSTSAEGVVPAQCRGVGQVARCLVLLPDTHHRSGGHRAGRHPEVTPLRAGDAWGSGATHSSAGPTELPGQGPQPLTALMT